LPPVAARLVSTRRRPCSRASRRATAGLAARLAALCCFSRGARAGDDSAANAGPEHGPQTPCGAAGPAVHPGHQRAYSRVEGNVKGARSLVAPRVLVDATAVPADRGALGRYVDGLISALVSVGADLA